MGLAAFSASLHAAPRWKPLSFKGIETRNTARNLIFVFLDGGPSHVDTFDLKTASYTPSSLGATTLANGLKWPSGIMPELAQLSDKFAILRSVTAIEAVHERATYHMLTSHRQNAAAMVDVPHFSSVLSYFESSRKPTDSLPSSIWIGPNPAKNGLFSTDHLGLQLSQNGQVRNLTHRQDGLDERLSLVDQLRVAGNGGSDVRQDHYRFQDQARDMMADPTLNALIDGEDDNYGGDRRNQGFLGQAEMAVRVLEADRGTRVIQLQSGGWDHHNQIYQVLPNLARDFDRGMAYLLRELDSRPARYQQGSLLDETLVVAVGEFGRTTGRLNNASGRDHYPYVVPALIGGGGVRTNVAIGGTNADGSSIVDPGWSFNRYMTISDLFATIYSALGVDYTTTFQDTPSGRLFELTPAETAGSVNEIDSLFA